MNDAEHKTAETKCRIRLQMKENILNPNIPFK